ncbi:GNAT family N-acetyltransferase [Neolewinella antarctica]|uniref:RimJ/RimL family protein N-acetyltransferase n=1 Tax=Neolewinella antarctica TaxID=442734 RepID=A0ABX0XDF2_9BACT|nr:GNAT family N-acetyltransferase [Neolewinella antarctica]NJC27326.1 RimJ/RimL family protein N-acetyltransferase [Neolewinella antarctica]
MNFQPTLVGERIRLRPLQREDFADFYAAVSDPLIWDQHPAKRYQPEIFEAFFADSLASGGCLVVETHDENKIIGSSRFQSIPGHPDVVEIGWTVLGRPYWGGAYNREMKQLMVAHLTALKQTALLNIAPGNHRSVGAAEKVGGRLVDATFFPELIDPRPGYRTYVLPSIIE